MTRTLLRNSERGAFKTCRFRWALAYGGVWELSPLRSREPAKALWFGDLVHQGLAAYYLPGRKRGPLPAKTFIALYDADERISAVLRNDEGEWESMRDLGRGMLEGYVEKYEAHDQEWEVISSEQTFQLPVKINGRTRFWVVGTFDGIWRHLVDKDRLAFKEFKTAASINLDGLAMDDQAGYYFTYGPRWLWRQGLLPRGVYPSEILYTFLRKAIRNPADTYDNEGHKLNKPTKADLIAAFPKLVDESMKLETMLGEVGPRAALAGAISKSQPPSFFERQPIYRDRADRENMHHRVLAEFTDMEAVRAHPEMVYKNPGPLHSPNCRGCAFREACELHETGNDFKSMLNATTEAWDPYAAHEIIERR